MDSGEADGRPEPAGEAARPTSQSSPAYFRGGAGEPVVLLHGFTATWRSWLPVLDILTRRFAVYAPTLAGHDGGGPFPEERGSSLVDAADHLEEHLRAEGFDSAHLVGNSMGGGLALELAKRGLARSVVAFSPAGGWESEAEAARIERFFRRQIRTTQAMQRWLPTLVARPRTRRLMLRDITYRGDRMKPEEALALAYSSLRCTITDHAYESLRSGEALLKDLDRIAVPTLVVWAEKDRVLPLSRHLERFRNEIPNVDVRIMPNVGHVPMSDEPELVAATIADWVAAHSMQAQRQAADGNGTGAAVSPSQARFSPASP